MLLDLVDGGSYTCSDIKTVTMDHVDNIRQKIADLQKLEKTLTGIASRCSDDATPECPIIDALFDTRT